MLIVQYCPKTHIVERKDWYYKSWSILSWRSQRIADWVDEWLISKAYLRFDHSTVVCGRAARIFGIEITYLKTVDNHE